MTTSTSTLDICSCSRHRPLAGNGFDESRFVTFETRREREREREGEPEGPHSLQSWKLGQARRNYWTEGWDVCYYTESKVEETLMYEWNWRGMG
jgi:hypothetical protein